MTGSQTATLSVEVTEGRNGYQFRCVVTDKKSNSVTSSAATLKVLATQETAQSAVSVSGGDVQSMFSVSGGDVQSMFSVSGGDAQPMPSVSGGDAQNQ